MKAHKYEIWKDNNNPVTRYVQVTADADQYGYVEITTILRSNEKYTFPEVIENGMVTYARHDRFNGLSDGYSYVAKNLKEFNTKKVCSIQFAQRLAKLNASIPVRIDVGTISVSPLPAPTPVVGEVWREVKGSCVRYVQIVGEQADGKVQILTRYYTNTPGARPQPTNEAKPTFAQSSRFNGKSSGYEYVAKNLTMLSKSGMLSQRFVPAGDTMQNVMKDLLPTISKGQIWHDVSNTTCFLLVQVVGMKDDMVEIATSYVSGADDTVKQPVRGRSELIASDEFAKDMNRFVLVNAA